MIVTVSGSKNVASARGESQYGFLGSVEGETGCSFLLRSKAAWGFGEGEEGDLGVGLFYEVGDEIDPKVGSFCGVGFLSERDTRVGSYCMKEVWVGEAS
jgi:hypothetical protein